MTVSANGRRGDDWRYKLWTAQRLVLSEAPAADRQPGFSVRAYILLAGQALVVVSCFADLKLRQFRRVVGFDAAGKASALH
jgi:hypothetical protein